MAQDMVAVMQGLGHERFSIVGHDRGGRVAYRLALDHPGLIERLILLDIVPTYAMWHRLNPELAMKIFHWMFLAQPDQLPEWLIGSDPVRYLEHKIGAWNARGGVSIFSPEALVHYRSFFAEPARLRATCDDYRAGATYDLKADEEDRARGRKIACPTLVLWGADGIPELAGEPVTIWKEWCEDVRGEAVDCGHFLVEEAPEATLALMLPFLRGQ
jgi:haloacetate dehalogenase